MTYQNVDASHELWYKIKCLFAKLTHLAMREWTLGNAETHTYTKPHLLSAW